MFPACCLRVRAPRKALGCGLRQTETKRLFLGVAQVPHRRRRGSPILLPSSWALWCGTQIMACGVDQSPGLRRDDGHWVAARASGRFGHHQLLRPRHRHFSCVEPLRESSGRGRGHVDQRHGEDPDGDDQRHDSAHRPGFAAIEICHGLHPVGTSRAEESAFIVPQDSPHSAQRQSQPPRPAPNWLQKRPT